MYKYSAIITLEQLTRVVMTDSDNGIRIINSNTFNAQMVGVTEIIIPPVSVKFLQKYPTCKNFIVGENLVLKVYHIQTHDIASSRRVNSSCNLITNITTSHVPKFSTRTIPPNGQLDVEVDSIENVRAKYCSEPIPYVPGDECPDDVVIADPTTSFSSMLYWLVSSDLRSYTSMAATTSEDLVSKCCNSSGVLVSDSGAPLKAGQLDKSHTLMMTSEELFSSVSRWPKPTGTVGVINGIRVEYNNNRTPDYLTLFIKKDWRELGTYP